MLEVQLDHRYCPTCESEQLFEAPLCLDGHDSSNPRYQPFPLLAHQRLRRAGLSMTKLRIGRILTET